MNSRVFNIPGGIHPPENKRQSLQRPLRFAGIPAQLILPLNMHLGAPAKPCVSVGEKVLKGQCIAQSNGVVSAPIHAPTSGMISAIEERPIAHSSGLNAPCIIIDTDGQDRWCDLSPIKDWGHRDATDLIEIIRRAGIAGMGGAGFPSAVKLATDKPIDTLVLNGVECEPYITADQILMTERAEQIMAGIAILKYLLKPQRILLGTEDNKPEAIAALQSSATNDVEVVVVPTKYPSGGEKQLIQLLTGREVPSGGLPADVGVVCLNVATAIAVHRAIDCGEPLISRITTLTGEAFKKPGNVEVLIGTPISYLMEQGECDEKKLSRLIMGGPMMGFTLPNRAVPIVKTSNCILAPTAAELPPPPPAQACIRCGMCAEACPASLLPQQLYWFSRASEHEKLEQHNLFDCIECGACSYSCPSNIPLVQYYRASKAEIRQSRIDAAKAEHAKQRFEARQARLQRLEEEKAAQRAARAEAAKKRAEQAAVNSEQQVENDPVQAAIARAKAKRSGTQETSASRVDEVSKLEKRLTAAKIKLASAESAGSDKLPQLQAAVDALAEQLAKAKASATEPTEAETNDPIQAAIERAKAKRAGKGGASNVTELDPIAKLEKRLTAAKIKLAAAESAGSDKTPQLQAAVDALAEQLEHAKQQTDIEVATDDPVQAAIERAQAKRAGKLTPQTPADEIAKLEKRLAAAKQKLAMASENAPDKLAAFQAGVDKLEEKLAAAKAVVGE